MRLSVSPTPSNTPSNTPSVTPSNSSCPVTPSFTPTNTPTISPTITATMNPICEGEVNIFTTDSNLSNYNGNYTRLYSYSGGSFTYAFWQSSIPDWLFDTTDSTGNYGVVYGKFSAGVYYTLLPVSNSIPYNIQQYGIATGTTSYVIGGFPGTTLAVDFGPETYLGVKYPSRGSTGTNNFYVSYSAICPTPTVTTTQTSTPTVTPTTTSTPTLTPSTSIYYYEVHYTGTTCNEACAQTGSVTLYWPASQGAVLNVGEYAYLDSSLTIVAPNAFYVPQSNTNRTVEITGGLGQITSADPSGCSNCPSPTPTNTTTNTPTPTNTSTPTNTPTVTPTPTMQPVVYFSLCSEGQADANGNLLVTAYADTIYNGFGSSPIAVDSVVFLDIVFSGDTTPAQYPIITFNPGETAKNIIITDNAPNENILDLYIDLISSTGTTQTYLDGGSSFTGGCLPLCSVITFYTDGPTDAVFEFTDCNDEVHQFNGPQGFSNDYCGYINTAVVISGDGFIEDAGPCADPLDYNPVILTLGYDASNGAASCTASTQTYYLIHGNILDSGTTIYTDYSVDVNYIASAGFYSDGTYIYEVDANGQIIMIYSCTCCYQYEVTNYYTTSKTVYYTDCDGTPQSISCAGNGNQTIINCAEEGSVYTNDTECNGSTTDCVTWVQASSPCGGCV